MMNYQRLANHRNYAADYKRAKELRLASPAAEQILWHKLRSSAKELKIRFRRQHPIHPYIVDFVCLKFRLVIELDGISHDSRLNSDHRRDNYLRKLGYEVMRFTNNDVMKNCEDIVLTILKRANERKTFLFIPLP